MLGRPTSMRSARPGFWRRYGSTALTDQHRITTLVSQLELAARSASYELEYLANVDLNFPPDLIRIAGAENESEFAIAGRTGGGYGPYDRRPSIHEVLVGQ